MTSILDQVGTKVGAFLKSLDLRMISAETQLTSLGAQVPAPTLFSINPVTWANMTEINIGGEQLINEDFSQSGTVPTSWTLSNGTLDQTKLSQGIVKGDNGSVEIQQMFATPIPIDTPLVVKAVREDTNAGTIDVLALKADGTPLGGNIQVNETAEFTTSQATYGLRLSTTNSNREVSSLSLFQGAVAGGSVQVTTGSIEKISGAVAFNAGASSSQVIGGQQEGYVQFQIESESDALKVGLVYADENYDVNAPYFMKFGGGSIDFSSPWVENHSTAVAGDWFRIRHYSSSNQIKFQKLQDIQGGSGQEYQTIYTHPTTTNGNDLKVDVSFSALGGKINDTQIATIQ